jgi:CBS domain-containing protein
MTEDPITVPTETDVEEAARIMLENGFRHLPVTDELGQVIGIASLRRVVGATQAAANPS